jgi:hypothetical protein
MFDINVTNHSSSEFTSSTKFQMTNTEYENNSFGQTSSIPHSGLFQDDSEYLPNFGTSADKNVDTKLNTNASQRSAPQYGSPEPLKKQDNSFNRDRKHEYVGRLRESKNPSQNVSEILPDKVHSPELEDFISEIPSHILISNENIDTTRIKIIK